MPIIDNYEKTDVTCDANGGTLRTGTVTIAGGAIVRTITISQEA